MSQEISSRRRKRGAIRGSITRLQTKLTQLQRSIQANPDQARLPDTQLHAQRISDKLRELDSDFKTQHLSVVELVEDDDTLEEEQAISDEHDDTVTEIAIAIEKFIASSESSPSEARSQAGKAAITRRLVHLRKLFDVTAKAITTAGLSTDSDVCLLEQLEGDLKGHKQELNAVSNELFTLDLDDHDELIEAQLRLETELSRASLSLRRQLHSKRDEPHPAGVKPFFKLPKIDIPKFNGDLLNWQSFWEQFSVSIHEQESISESEKLVYLRHSLSDGSAKNAIEGLSRSGNCYQEAIDCIKSRYNRPRLIHQTHVRKITDCPPLKDGSGKELRKLHDTLRQHLRALKAMGCDPGNPFVTSIIELKLDPNTMFEWQKYSQEQLDVPHYETLLDFIDLRAQASESSIADSRRKPETRHMHKPITSYTTTTTRSGVTSGCPPCPLCSPNKHPLYACAKFKALSHADKVDTVKVNNLCFNCLKSGHSSRSCKSVHHCKTCNKSHHSLLHITDFKPSHSSDHVTTTTEQGHSPSNSTITSNTALGLDKNLLLMTCKLIVESPEGVSVEVRGLLDSASSASFISERLAQILKLHRTPCKTQISGIGGISYPDSTQSTATFVIAPTHCPSKRMTLSAIIVPKVTCDLPTAPVTRDCSWNHLRGIKLADPQFDIPGRIDVLLGVEIFASALLQGRRSGPNESPVAVETVFGWVLAGSAPCSRIASHTTVIANHVSTANDPGDILRKFWEIEEPSTDNGPVTIEERFVADHFEKNHTRHEDGSFTVPLPRKPNHKPIGESRSTAAHRFLNLERSLRAKGHFEEFGSVIDEYFEMQHAEVVPQADLEKPPDQVFYLPMHAVRKESSSTTKLRVVFDASAKSTTGVSLNDTLLVGHTVHSSLVDVLLRFRSHRVGLIADISKMYRAVRLSKTDRDFHRFLWRRSPDDALIDYRMTRVTFGVSASCFAANMSVKQNALELASQYPLAAKVVHENFYVDDCLTGSDSVEEAIVLREQLQEMLQKGGFLLRKWNSNNAEVINSLPPELKGTNPTLSLPNIDTYTKTLGIEWNSAMDCFRLTVAELPPLSNITKRFLTSDVAKTFDVLGWFSPSIIVVKVLLQRLWELKINWDDTVPQSIQDVWLRWRKELSLLNTKHIPRYYFETDAHIVYRELHGFSDASESAYAAVVYFRITDSDGNHHTSLVTAKTKVAPIKKQTIPRLELCGAVLLAKVLDHLRSIFDISLKDTYAWTDSTVVLNWLIGNPRRFKTFVNNRVAEIVDKLPAICWRHVSGIENPADCASRGLLPSELIVHELWWNGPHWLLEEPVNWPKQSIIPVLIPEEERDVCLTVIIQKQDPIIPFNRYSSYARLKRVSAWMMRYIENSRKRDPSDRILTPYLSNIEIVKAEIYILSVSQKQSFEREFGSLKQSGIVRSSSCLRSLNPFIDSHGLIRVGGRIGHSKGNYDKIHPVIMHGKNPLTKLIIRSEHLRILHGGVTAVTAMISLRFHIIGGRKIIRDIIRQCIRCRRVNARTSTQTMGSLPVERITPSDHPFSNVGIDFAGPFHVKYGYVRKPTIVKAYVCVFVSLSVKAAHLELVTDLTTEAFVASLRRFISRRGKPDVVMSDNGTNFVGANRELREITEFLKSQKVQGIISDFCSLEHIEWKFIPERAPHFGGLWEAAVKSMKLHLRKVIGDIKLSFEELYTLITQVEACLNSRPLAPLPDADEGIEVLTPGHFLIGRSLQSLPDPSASYQSISLLKRWHLVQALTRHFWKRWSSEYLITLSRINKWQSKKPNLREGDIVAVKEDTFTTPSQWPIARVVKTYPGSDGRIRVASIKTPVGIYKRPITKLVLLLSSED